MLYYQLKVQKLYSFRIRYQAVIVTKIQTSPRHTWFAEITAVIRFFKFATNRNTLVPKKKLRSITLLAAKIIL